MDRGRPEKLTDELKTYITGILIKHPKRTAKDIRGDVRLHLITIKKKQRPDLPDKEVMRTVDSEELPGESVITKYLTPIKSQLKKPSHFDNPWSIGSCIKYDIPADMIPVLIKIQQVRELVTQKAQLGQITIRQARWFARLYPSVQGLAKKHYQDIVSAMLKLLWVALQDVPQYERKDQISKSVEVKKPEMLDFEDVKLLLLVILGLHYASKERVSELTGEDYPETSDLDNRYFIREDVSAVAFFEALQSVGLNAIISEQHKRRGFEAKELEASFGKLTASQIEMLNEYVTAALSGFSVEWLNRHPEIAELMKTLEAKEHERLNNQEV